MLRSTLQGRRVAVALLTRRSVGKLVLVRPIVSSSGAPFSDQCTKNTETRILSRGSNNEHQTLRRDFASLSTTPSTRVQFSSLALEIESDSEDEEEHDNADRCHDKNRGPSPKDRHCETCTCDDAQEKQTTVISATPAAPPLSSCGAVKTEFDPTPFPPPLPEPKYSVRRRLLSAETTALQSATGQQMLVDSLQQGTASSYIALTQQFLNQAEPAYCGVTTACMVLNALEHDSVYRWKGGWRYYADENVLLEHCNGCWSKERLQRAGITVDEFQRLVTCHGIDSTLKRPCEESDVKDTVRASNKGCYSLDDFRSDVQNILSGNNNNNEHRMGVMVVSFCRSSLGQTGEGHFSPVAAYHEATDSVLVLDVARYKYPPYWVSVELLYKAMQPHDSATNKPRGWYLMYGAAAPNDNHALGENRRPAHLVPLVGRDSHPCPMHKVQVTFCPNQEKSKNAKTTS